MILAFLNCKILIHKGNTFPEDAFKSFLLLHYDQYFDVAMI